MTLYAHKNFLFFLPLICTYYAIKTFLILKGLLSLHLPPYEKTAHKYDLEDIIQINVKIEMILNRLIMNSSHFCFYRSYVATSIFRRLRVPVQINIGLRGLEGKQNCAGGHAWLTLDKQFLRDEKEVKYLYPFELGMDSQGINYLAGRKASKHLLRVKQPNRSFLNARDT